MNMHQLTASVWPEDDGYVAACVEIEDLVSQGDTPEEAMANLREATEAFFRFANEAEKAERYHQRAHLEHFELANG